MGGFLTRSSVNLKGRTFSLRDIFDRCEEKVHLDIRLCCNEK